MEYYDWITLKCGCHNGIRWGGDEPVDCTDCNGGGFLWLHRSGMLAEWPGGPAAGRLMKTEVDNKFLKAGK